MKPEPLHKYLSILNYDVDLEYDKNNMRRRKKSRGLLSTWIILFIKGLKDATPLIT